MLIPDVGRLRISACLNGWYICMENWNHEQQCWDDGKTYVFQDVEVLSQFLTEQLIGLKDA